MAELQAYRKIICIYAKESILTTPKPLKNVSIQEQVAALSLYRMIDCSLQYDWKGVFTLSLVQFVHHYSGLSTQLIMTMLDDCL